MRGLLGNAFFSRDGGDRGLLGNMVYNQQQQKMAGLLGQQLDPDTPWKYENLPVDVLQKMLVEKIGPKDPIKVSEGESFIDPRTFQPLYEAPKKPIQVAEGGTLWDPNTNKSLFTAPRTGNRGGATGELVDRLLKDRPGLGFGDALYQIQTGWRKGTQIDPTTGEVASAPGYADAMGANKYGEKAGDQRAVRDYAGPIEQQKQIGKTVADRKLNLNNVVASAQNSINLIDQVTGHKGMKYAVGKSSVLPVIPGTDAASFRKLLDQVKGGQFLQAFEALKGGGAISEIEGAKATAAISRMDTAQKEEDFLAAAQEYRDIIAAGIERAKQGAQYPVDGPMSQMPRQGGGSVFPNMERQGASAPSFSQSQVQAEMRRRGLAR
jgi:hypothetical protein